MTHPTARQITVREHERPKNGQRVAAHSRLVKPRYVPQSMGAYKAPRAPVHFGAVDWSAYERDMRTIALLRLVLEQDEAVAQSMP